jgi:hypothetical protein
MTLSHRVILRIVHRRVRPSLDAKRLHHLSRGMIRQLTAWRSSDARSRPARQWGTSAR